MILIILLLILTVIFFPYVKRAVLRIAYVRKLKKVCAMKKYTLKLGSPISFCLKNFSDRCDFTVDTGKTIYAVKFWNEVYKHSNIVFNFDGKVLVRRKIPETFGKENKRAHGVSERTLGNFKKLELPEAKGRKTLGILLIDASKIRPLYHSGDKLIPIKSGDRLYGMTVISAAELFRVINR